MDENSEKAKLTVLTIIIAISVGSIINLITSPNHDWIRTDYTYASTTTNEVQSFGIYDGTKKEQSRTNTNYDRKWWTSIGYWRTNQSGEMTSTWPIQPLLMHNDVATEIANYMWNINPDPDMISTFVEESGLNPNARWKAGEYGLCQLMPNKTNLVRIRDERWQDWKRQADVCISKWLSVEDKGVIRMAYKHRHKHLHYFTNIEWIPWNL